MATVVARVPMTLAHMVMSNVKARLLFVAAVAATQPHVRTPVTLT